MIVIRCNWRTKTLELVCRDRDSWSAARQFVDLTPHKSAEPSFKRATGGVIQINPLNRALNRTFAYFVLIDI